MTAGGVPPRRDARRTYGEGAAGSTDANGTAFDEAGMRLWHSVVAVYDLEEHELALLREACSTVDLLAHLEADVRRDGGIIDSPHGRKAHPAAVELRQQRIALARLLAALRLPAGEEGDEQASARTPRRVGARGVYRVGGLR